MNSPRTTRLRLAPNARYMEPALGTNTRTQPLHVPCIWCETISFLNRTLSPPLLGYSVHKDLAYQNKRRKVDPKGSLEAFCTENSKPAPTDSVTEYNGYRVHQAVFLHMYNLCKPCSYLRLALPSLPADCGVCASTSTHAHSVPPPPPTHIHVPIYPFLPRCLLCTLVSFFSDACTRSVIYLVGSVDRGGTTNTRVSACASVYRCCAGILPTALLCRLQVPSEHVCCGGDCRR